MRIVFFTILLITLCICLSGCPKPVADGGSGTASRGDPTIVNSVKPSIATSISSTKIQFKNELGSMVGQADWSVSENELRVQGNAVRLYRIKDFQGSDDGTITITLGEKLTGQTVGKITTYSTTDVAANLAKFYNTDFSGGEKEIDMTEKMLVLVEADTKSIW